MYLILFYLIKIIITQNNESIIFLLIVFKL